MSAFDLKDKTNGMTPEQIGDSIRSGRTAKSIAELQAATGMVAGDTAYLSLGGRTGPFQWDSSDLSTQVAADTLQGVYIAPASDVTGASGAWVRKLEGYVTPEMFGGDGQSDENSFLSAAAGYSSSTGVPTLLNRIYKSSGTVTFNSCTVYSENNGGIESTTQGSGAVILTGESPSAIGILKTYTGAATRSAADNACGILILSATNPVVRGCHVSGASGAGVFARGCTNVSISNNLVHDTLADGIHLTGFTTVFNVSGNLVYSTGDDGIACVSYVSDSGQSGNGTISGNKVSSTGARGIACAGSSLITISGNSIDSTAVAGIIVNSDNTYSTMAPGNVNISGNTVHNCGSATGTIQPAVVVFGRSGYVASNIKIRNNTISSAKYRALSVGTTAGSMYVSDVDVCGNSISDSENTAIIFQGVKSLSCSSNSIYEVDGAGLIIDGCSGNTLISGNVFTDINRTGATSNDVIQFTNGFTYSRISICNNLHSNPGGYTVDRMVSCLYDDAIIFGNISDDDSILGVSSSGKARYNRTRRECEMSAVPSTGVWDAGDWVWDKSGVNTGWRCTVSGDFSGTPPTFVTV